MSVLTALLLIATPAAEPAEPVRERDARDRQAREARTVELEPGFFSGSLTGGVGREPSYLIVRTAGARVYIRETRPSQPFSMRSSAISKSSGAP
ncbi:MAG: hypothetical protein ABL308_06510 [Oceanicaulis sp.]